jgi:hypothetical protein
MEGPGWVGALHFLEQRQDQAHDPATDDAVHTVDQGKLAGPHRKGIVHCHPRRYEECTDTCTREQAGARGHYSRPLKYVAHHARHQNHRQYPNDERHWASIAHWLAFAVGGNTCSRNPGSGHGHVPNGAECERTDGGRENFDILQVRSLPALPPVYQTLGLPSNTE